MNDTEIPSLSLSESFYSIQGEGITSGVPAVFIRLRGCNFMCGGVNGSLMKEGKATWWCDTEAVWRQGKTVPITGLIDSWKAEGIYDWILRGQVHLVWTGGEPTMPKHQKDIVACINYICKEPNILFNELETNGSIYIGDELFDAINQINCSPKLANSGMSAEKRIVPAAIKRITYKFQHQFKFVVSTEDDVKEIIRDFVEPFSIDAKNVVLMPGLDAQANFHERTRFTLEVAKKYGFIGLTRLHVSAWDKTTGV